MGVARIAGSYVLFPDVIDRGRFRSMGFPEERLIPYRGLKEDITFAALDVDAIAAHSFPELQRDDLVRVLFRPPAEESHYYREESGSLSHELLEFLAGRDDIVLVLSPRYPRQVEYLSRHSWAVPPVVLDRAVSFVSLLKAVDLVVSGGGTMIREAAYLGVPAYSMFRGEQGGVDRHLESVGRLTLIASRADFEQLRLVKAGAAAAASQQPRAPTGARHDDAREDRRSSLEH